eukprot:9472550-Pyramimonas_sp.AAC.1
MILQTCSSSSSKIAAPGSALSLCPLSKGGRGVKPFRAVFQTVQGAPNIREILILDAASKILQPMLEPSKRPGVGRPALAPLGTLHSPRPCGSEGGSPGSLAGSEGGPFSR